MSYRSTHIKPKIKSVKSRKVIFQRPVFFVPLIIVAILVMAYFFILFYSSFQVTHIQVSGQNSVSNQDIEKIVSNSMHARLLIGALGGGSNSIFFVSTQRIEQD